MRKTVALLGSAALLAAGAVTPAAAQFKAALEEAQRTVDEGRVSQQRVEELDAEATELLGEYRANLKQLELLERFNETRAREVENQLADIQGLEQDIENVQGLQRAVTPLMEEMLGQLEALVNADIPFLSEERQARIARLRRVMADSTQTPASRYRLIIEAFQIENEYGRTIEAYNGTVTDDAGEERAVEFLRIGRVALIYKTSDDAVLKIYNTETGAFDDLPMAFLGDVRQALRVAKEQAPPNLLTIPVEAPVDATAE
jgi:vacuolar-type H+-ATPase subunit I/STV1